MYQNILDVCSAPDRASGPAIDLEMFFENPVYQTDVIETVTMVPRREYSRYISDLMDRLGYSYDMIKHRQQSFDEESKVLTQKATNVWKTCVITGGKGEGTSLFLESDFDLMVIINTVLCADNPQRDIHDEDITLFQTERHDTSPGYTRMKLLRLNDNDLTPIKMSLFESLFESETGLLYLSSQFSNNSIWKADTEGLGPTSGPSLPLYCKCFSTDNVLAFTCFCPDILERWVSRPRCYGWPSPDIIHEISLLDGHVVPVGFKGSHNMYREWRICYSLAELRLMRNLNGTQLKVYILLKKISKAIIKPVCDDITSYVMKNVVFWICEANVIERFSRDMLMDRLLDCIIYLRACVNENNLPSYMIPERNLLAGRLDIQKKQELTSLLSDLLDEGGNMLLRCNNLRDAMLVMYKTPAMLKEFSEKRDKIESLVLMQATMKTETVESEMSGEQNEQYCDISDHIMFLAKFDGRAFKQMGKSDDEISDLWQMRLCQLLS